MKIVISLDRQQVREAYKRLAANPEQSIFQIEIDLGDYEEAEEVCGECYSNPCECNSEAKEAFEFMKENGFI